MAAYTASRMDDALRVLIIDDNEEARFCLREQLQTGGHIVVGEAATQTQALEEFRRHRPNLILLDLSLEKENGLDVLKAIRSENADARVIVISGNEMKRVREAALAAGASRFLVKPVKADELVAVLAAL